MTVTTQMHTNLSASLSPENMKKRTLIWRSMLPIILRPHPEEPPVSRSVLKTSSDYYDVSDMPVFTDLNYELWIAGAPVGC
jgi:hypothetical protein